MASHQSLVLHAKGQPMSLETGPRPTPKAGEAVVRILGVDIVPYMSEVLDGRRPYPLSLPMTPGNTAIGRVHEVGPDAVLLKPGQLVFCDITIRGRDNPCVTILYGVHGGGYPAAQQLMDGEWRNGTYAEFARFPLENLYPMNEDQLLGKIGYTISDLCVISHCLVPFGGLCEVGLKSGEIVVVAPATGRYGGAAVAVALAMGATVVAAGRNAEALQSLQHIHGSTGRLMTVKLSENSVQNTKLLQSVTAPSGGADVFLDFSPPAAKGMSLLTSAVGAMRPFGRCLIMGGVSENISVPYLEIMFKNLRLQGRFMYSRDHALQLIRIVESGLLPLGTRVGIHHSHEFALASFNEALEVAANLKGWGSHVVLTP
ncbi:hypothetical protein Plec18170_003893 [Paecilomyces lecythidis]